MLNLTEISILKSRSGVYQDTPKNRRLHRVGMRYGVEKKQEPIKELKERADKVVKDGKEQKDKALQEAINEFKNKQADLKKKVKKIEDLIKKVKGRSNREKLEDIRETFYKWKEDYGGELEIDIEEDVKDGLDEKDVRLYIDELEEYAISYFNQDIAQLKEELQEMISNKEEREKREPQTPEEFRELGSEMTNKQLRKYLKTPEGKERSEQFLSKRDKILNESRKAFEKPQKVMNDFVKKINLPGSITYDFEGRAMDRSDRLMYYGIIGKYIKGEGWSEVFCIYYPDNGETEILPRSDDEKGDIEMAQILSKNNELIGALKLSGKYFSEAYKVKDKLSELEKEYPEMYDKKGRIRV